MLIERRAVDWSVWVASLMLCGMAAAAGGTVQEQARQMLEASGVKGGLIVHVGCGDGRLTAALRVNDRFLVHGLDTNPVTIAKARARILEMGRYGPVSVDTFDGVRLPYADNLANLIVVSDVGGRVPREELLRVLAPGGVALAPGSLAPFRKPWPKTIDEWTHFLHGPDNNAVARDRVVGIPRSMQWVAGPRWGRSHEELASMSAAVTAKGRLYYIEDEAPLASIRFRSDWELVARDAFNGTLLWKRPIAAWIDRLRHFRSGPVHLPRRLVADGDSVFMTAGLSGPVLALDGATGQTLRTYQGTERTEEIVVSGGVLYLVVGTSEANRRGRGLFDRGEPKPTSYRYVTAIAAETGKVLWKKDLTKDNILPLTLAVKGPRVYYQSTAAIVCLDARSGEQVWVTPRQTPRRRMSFSAPTLVATDEVILSADRDVGKTEQNQPSTGQIEWGVNGWSEKGFPRRGTCTLRAYSAKDGKELWAAKCSEGYNSPVDVFVINGIVWVGTSFKGLDLKTGAVVRRINTKGARVGMPHHRCYRDKASERFIFTGKSGIEVISLEKGWLCNNSWVRGTCQYGIIPANGLLYAPPDPCACFLTVKEPGFFAVAPSRQKNGKMPFPREPVIEKGPRYGEPLKRVGPEADEWPMYRHDSARSGAVPTSIPEAPTALWAASVGGRLTQPAIVAGKVFVASIDAHTVYALSADDGRQIWRFTAGGRIDSTPTIHKGRVIFGSADGWVYNLSAADGALAWRFRAAPQDVRVGAYGQLESIWPVHGAVLVQNDTVYVAAGRSSYLDGGIVLYRLDPATGRELSKTVLCHIDPKTGRQLARESRFNMEGTTADVLSGNGDLVFLKYFCFDREGQRTQATAPHLFSITSLLGEEWFVRSYWIIGEGMPGAGWSFWTTAANAWPSGRILCFDTDRVYGYGRRKVMGGRVGHRADAYHLFASSTKPGPVRTDRRGRKRRTKLNPIWEDVGAPIVRAMVLGADRLAVAGPTDIAQRDPDRLAYKNEAEALAAFKGEKGASLRIVRTSDGMRMSEWRLNAMPVFDGMAAAKGRLYLALKDGRVLCLAPRGGKPLPGNATPTKPKAPKVAAEPSAQDMARALSGPSKRGDFSHVVAERVIGSGLGYRLASKKGQMALALRKLEQPLEKKATMKLKLQRVSAFRYPRRFENGFLAFGDAPEDARLIKCGVKFVVGSAVILLGPIDGQAVQSCKIQLPKSGASALEIVVDLAAQTVSLKVGGRKINAKLGRPLKSIAYVGYSTLNAATDFGPIEIRGE